MEVELFRLILAFVCGYLLTVSGSLTQLMTHNDLASPSTLGFDGLAVLGVIVGQMLLIFTGINIDLSFAAMISTIFMILALLGIKILLPIKNLPSVWQISSMKNVILIGLSFNLLIAAVFSVVQFLFVAMNFSFPTSIWFGSFKQFNNYEVAIFILVFIGVLIWVRANVKKVEYFNLGSHFCLNRGLSVDKFQFQALLISLMITCLIISFYGVFSFLGLVFPHILRRTSWWRNNISGELLWGPFLTGVIFAIFDLVCFNLVVQGAEFPVGLISSVIGALVLMFLIGKSANYSR